MTSCVSEADHPAKMTTNTAGDEKPTVLEKHQQGRTTETGNLFHGYLNHKRRAENASSRVTLTVQVGLAAWFAWKYDVPAVDVLFSFGYAAYLLLVNRFRFDSNRLAQIQGRRRPNHDTTVPNNLDMQLIPDSEEPWFARYMVFYATIGLILPLGTIVMGPRNMAVLCAPHLFVLCMQIIMEGLLVMNENCHDLVRILVPIGYSAYRERSLMVWCTEAFVATESAAEMIQEPWWYWWGLVLSVFNLVAWTYNLFGFLLLRMTPNFIDRQRSPTPEVSWKGQLIPCLVAKPSPSTSTREKL